MFFKCLNLVQNFVAIIICMLCGDKMDKNEVGGHVARMEGRRGVYRILVGKSEGK